MIILIPNVIILILSIILYHLMKEYYDILNRQMETIRADTYHMYEVGLK